MFPATVPALKSSHDPSAPRLALMERAREKASRCARDDSGGSGEMGGYVGPKGPTPKAAGALSELPTGARNSRSLAAFGMTVAEVARCFQRLCPRLSPATIPRLRGWRSRNEHGKKPAAALGMTSWSGDGACGYVGPKGPTPKAAGALSELPTGARNSRSLTAFGMTT